MNKPFAIAFLFTILCGVGCRQENAGIAISEVPWGEYKGKEVKLFTLKNENGMVLKVTNYGATITCISVPDKDDVFDNVVIGYDSLQNYVDDFWMRGRTIGRYANRIGAARFTLNGITYELTANNGPNTLHGGPHGFSSQVFEIDTTYSRGDSSRVAFHYFSADMEEGFPGNLTLYINFVLTNMNEVKILYEAVTDKLTVVNFTNHSYFNLTGNEGPVLDHKIKIIADSVTETGPDGLPTGVLSPVKGTQYDFTEGNMLKENLGNQSRGFDINYVLNKEENALALAAEVTEPESGRFLEAYTTEPGMQLFTTNNAICLEMQHFPDSPNKPNFPSVVLNPGERYRQVTIYKFSLIKP